MLLPDGLEFPRLLGSGGRTSLPAYASLLRYGNPTAVRRHTEQVRAELQRAGVPADAASRLARAHVFGNVQGDYGTGLSEAVQSEELRTEDQRLGDLFLDRMKIGRAHV